jgi:hypothetical protein
MKSVSLALDRQAVAIAGRQAVELCARYAPDSIPPDMLRATERAFHEGAWRALIDSNLSEIEAHMARLMDIWKATLETELGRERRKRVIR